MFPLWSALAPGAALLAGYLLCRLWCVELPALLGAAAWALSEGMLRPNGFSGAVAPAVPGPLLLVPFALAGVFSRGRTGRAFLVLGLACVALRLRFPEGSGGGPASLLEGLVLAVLAALGAQRLWDGEGGPAFLLGAVAAVAVMSVSMRRGLELGSVLAEAVPLAAAIVLVAVLTRETRARAGLAALVALFVTQRALELVLAAGREPDPAPIVWSANPEGISRAARP